MRHAATLVVLTLAGACGTDEPAPDGARDVADVGDVLLGDMVGTQRDTAIGLPDVTMRDDGSDLGISPDPGGPTRYHAGAIVQPITQSVVDSMAAIRARSATPDDEVFMKVGASGTVNLGNLTCFGPTSSYVVDLDGRATLQGTIDRFNVQTFGAEASWDRTTLAAEVGRTASWAQSGSPSPVEREIAAINPRFALVNYGTNDMQQGVTHATALWPFIDNMRTLLASLVAEGIVPIVTGLNPRGDTTPAAQWVPSYDAATRALAEELQVPYLDLYLAVKDLADRGLISDGIHGNASPSGPCVFTAAGLAYNYNVRNLRTLELLDELARTLLDGGTPTAPNPTGWSGAGTPDDPVVVDELPFSHRADTAASASSAIDGYPDCDTGQNESGPEIHYALELTAATPLRAMVFDKAGVDVDIHLMAGAACLARNDRMIQGTFGPGQYTIVVDTFVTAAGGPQAGNYTFVILMCEPGDADCG